MTRQKTIKMATARGWKPWGALRRYGHSSYQCFRRGNEYLWIGLRYVERSGYANAHDFVSNHPPVREIIR